MSEDTIDLARRAVACKGWKWLPGMLGWRTNHKGEQVRVRFVECVEDQELVDPRITVRKPSMTPIFQWGFSTVAGWSEASTILPDLRDPATLGCLLALVREAWGNPRLRVSRPDGSDAEALVYALEAAP